MNREKMVCSILLLIILTSCVSGTFVVNVTQTSYQAEENQDITLEWTFTTRTKHPLNSFIIYCELLTVPRPLCLFNQHGGVEVPESQDEQFAGRVQCDEDVLRKGRLRLHVSRLRTEDSGMYKCQLITVQRSSPGGIFLECLLNVTAARDRPEPETPDTSSPPSTTSPPQPQSRGRIGLYCGLGLGLTAAALLGFFAVLFLSKVCFSKSPDEKRNLSPVV